MNQNLRVLLVLSGGVALAPAVASAAAPSFDIRDGFAHAAAATRPETNARTGTPRAELRLGTALSAPSGARPAAIGRRFLREHARTLGLDRHDVAALGAPHAVHAPGGLTLLRFPQRVGGIPAFDDEATVAVDRHGRVITVGGSPVHDLQAATTTPRVSALAAQSQIARSVHRRPIHAITRPARGLRRRTHFAGGDRARLVLFDERAGQPARLAWHLSYRDRAHGAWYDGVVDATTGRLLRRVDTAQHAAGAAVYGLNPGARVGGDPVPVDLEGAGYLPAGATTLTGPNAHAFSDLDANGRASAAEEVTRTAAGDFVYPFTSFNGRNIVTSGDPAYVNCTSVCGWNSDDPTSWQTNRAQTTTQLFWDVNVFHDHLAAAPIGFDAASGAFEGDDALKAQADVGATKNRAGNGPDFAHINNSFMETPMDGISPSMTMELNAFALEHYTGQRRTSGYQDTNNSDDARIVFHEYTHGMTNRLIKYSDGSGAVLTGFESGALNEAWSDWFSLDYLAQQGLIADDPGTAGQVAYGAYIDSQPNVLRLEAIDCPVASPAPNCAGQKSNTTPRAAGGFTLGDFGHLFRPLDTHVEAEIWAQTLWSIRDAFVLQTGSQLAGSQQAEALVAAGMRLTPAFPSFLDARNAILQADVALFDGRDGDLLQQVFASRGMGYFASASDGNDTHPIADFSLRPAGAPEGTLTGRVTDADTGRPVRGARVSVAGLSTLGAATTDARGRYSLGGIVARRVPSVIVTGPGGYLRDVLHGVTITGGGAAVRNVELRRSLAYGATITPKPAGFNNGCGAGRAIDADTSSAWSLDPGAVAIIKLRKAVRVSSYAIDGRPGCNTTGDTALTRFKLESSADGKRWTTVTVRTLTHAGGPATIDPAPGMRKVRYLRLTLLASKKDTSAGISVRELMVFGRAG